MSRHATLTHHGISVSDPFSKGHLVIPKAANRVPTTKKPLKAPGPGFSPGIGRRIVHVVEKLDKLPQTRPSLAPLHRAACGCCYKVIRPTGAPRLGFATARRLGSPAQPSTPPGPPPMNKPAICPQKRLSKSPPRPGHVLPTQSTAVSASSRHPPNQERKASALLSPRPAAN
jgi:hypothetical protein